MSHDFCEAKRNCQFADISCWYCKFSHGGLGVDNNYRPIDKTIIHPQALIEKEEKKKQTKEDKKTAKQQKNKDKSSLVKKASKLEDIVKSTLNSGRINKDGDLKTEDLMIDTKLQSTRVNPVIDVDEFKKAQNDAVRCGKKHGVLAIQNSNGEMFYVVSEELFRSFI